MKNRILIIGLSLFFLIHGSINAQEVKSVHNLFKALKSHPQTKGDVLASEKATIGKQMAFSNLFPTISAYTSFDSSSDPTGMVPVTPNGSSYMVQHQEIPQPFSDQIFKAGLSVSMPVFIKSIYTTANEAKHLQKSAQAKQQINLLQNEAIIVSSNANLLYLDAFTKALESKKTSLLKTKEIIEAQVKNGRASGSSLLIINSSIQQVEATKNEIEINKEQAISTIETLTGIRVDNPIQMFESSVIDSSALKSLEPLEQKVLADKLAYRAEKEKLLPSIALRANYTYSSGIAYNNDISVSPDFSTIGVVVSVPIFDKKQLTQIKKSKLNYDATSNEFEKLELSLKSQAIQLKNSLQLLYKSENLYQQSIQDKEEILNIEKVSFQSGRITIEDYLKYEDDLVLEKSKLYKAQAEKWQTLVKLAVIYGNNIENLVK
ncbi:MAG: TolC family protein [Flavobacteriaceae bacterium]|nr:TolC family protein [Flavobacteriaceae bacterium]